MTTASVELAMGSGKSHLNVQRAMVERAVDVCVRAGARRIGVFGAGRHTRRHLSAFGRAGELWVVVLDDDPDTIGEHLSGRAVAPACAAAELGIDTVVLSSDAHEAALWNAAEQFRLQGMRVVPVYGRVDEAGVYTESHDAAIVQDEHGSHGRLWSIDPAWLDARPDRPEDAFRFPYYRSLTQRRLEHLASLGLPVRGKSVLEVGAGVGELTSFFADRGCLVHATDAREENLEVLREAYRHMPQVRAWRMNADDPPGYVPRRYDIVFCYGLLYHLSAPDACLAYCAKTCAGQFILETVVDRGADESINPCQEDGVLVSQAYSGTGCRPTRAWVMARLREHFEHVYTTLSQPAHREFPTDWRTPGDPAVLSRAVFVASRTPLEQKSLTTSLPNVQTVHL